MFSILWFFSTVNYTKFYILPNIFQQFSISLKKISVTHKILSYV